MKKKEKKCIIIFIKYPEKGKVKTRLARAIGESTAAALYKCFVEVLLGTLNKTKTDLCVYFQQREHKNKLIGWLGNKYRLFPQQGTDLGERMKNAFVEQFGENYDKILLIGSDIPDLSTNIIEIAFAYLKENDAVIGPAFDGGYYLIGFNKNKFLPGAFSGITWSTSEVFDKTVKILRKNGIGAKALPELHDIDKATDLKYLSKTGSMHFKIVSCLKKIEALRA